MSDAPEVFPPEVNSYLVHSGGGPEPMAQAASGFATGAAQDQASAHAIRTILSGVQSQWGGQTAQQAEAQLQPLIAWFMESSANGTQTATQLLAASAAVAQAISTTPHPVLVGQNRVTWGTLNATNFMGVNTPAINEKDAEYGAFWLAAAQGRGTSDMETEVATGSLAPWQPPPLTVNTAMMGAPVAQASGVAATAAAQAGFSAAQSGADEAAMSGLLAQGAAGDVAGAAGDGRPSSALLASAAQQGDQSKQADHTQQGADKGLGQLTGGAQQAGSLGSELPQLLSSVGQLPTQGIQEATQPLSQLTQLPTQFASMLQPLLNSSAMGKGLGGAQSAADAAGRFATGSGALSAAITRPASLGGVGGGGLRLPGSASLGEPNAAATEPAEAAAESAASGARTAGSGAAAGGPGMYGAPMQQNKRDQRSEGNKYDTGNTLGPAARAS